MQTCKILQKFKGHTAPISTIKSCVVEGSDDNTFLSTGADGYIKVWNQSDTLNSITMYNSVLPIIALGLSCTKRSTRY